MSELVTDNDVLKAFETARDCAAARNCKKSAEAMLTFYQRNNQMVTESGDGLVVFCGPVVGECPNQDQLLCQDNRQNI